MNRIVFASLAILCLLSISSVTGLIRIVKADGEPIYINADGSITPSTAPVYTADNITYTLTSNITSDTDGIVIERNNIVFNGAGYFMTGSRRGNGTDLINRNNVTIKNTNIYNFQDGIYLNSSNNITVRGNNVTANSNDGIDLEGSSNSTVSENNATANSNDGIDIHYSSNNTVSSCYATANGIGIDVRVFSDNNTVSGNNAIANVWGFDVVSDFNNISGNNATASSVNGIVISGFNNIVIGNNINANTNWGIWFLDSCYGNIIFHNNIVGNGVQTIVDSNSVGNTWDDGYPSGGNYFSNYNGTDLYSGPYQNVTGSDGIGDVPYVIYASVHASDIDHYPLMGAFSDFKVAQNVDVQVVSNSTVSDFQSNGTAILFNVSGTNDTTGFCTICIPTALINGTFKVIVNGTNVPYTLLARANSTKSYLYFTYSHSTEQIIIAPEFPSFLILTLFFILTLLAVIVYKKKGVKTRQS